MTEPHEPRWSGFVPAALLGACLLSIAAAGAALPAGWRLFSLTAGSIALSSSAASAAIVLGAALGVVRPGRHARGRIRTGGGEELRIGLLAAWLSLAVALSPVLFSGVRAASLALWPLFGGKAAGTWALRLVLGVALFSWPAFLLTRLTQALSRLIGEAPGTEGVGSGFSLGLGLSGLALGVLSGGVVLLPALGMRGTFFVALALAGLGAAGTVLLSRSIPVPAPAPAQARPEDEAGAFNPRPRFKERLLLGLPAWLLGFALWCAFLCWSRTLALLVGPIDQTVWVGGAIFLIGLALGALIASGAGVPARPLLVVPLTAAAGLLIYGSMFLVPWLATFYLKLAPGYAAGGLAAILSAMVAFILILPPALFQGAALAGLPSFMPAGLLLGVLVAAVSTPLVLVPDFGLRRSLSLAAAAGLLAALFLLGRTPQRRSLVRGTVVVAGAGATVLAVAFPAAWDPRIVGAGLYRYAASALERLGSSERYLEGRLQGPPPLFYREGSDACVVVESVVRSAPGRPDVETYSLRLDGRSVANDGSDLSTQILTGEIPLLLHGPAESVLMIDFLTGVTAGSILRHPIRSLVVIEREPAVLKAGALFAQAAGNPLGDSRLSLIADSPRARLQADPAGYDVIILNAMDPWLPHAAASTTTEGYALLRRRLNPRGLLAQRLSLAAADEPAQRVLLRTFARSFGSVTLFQLTPDDLLLVGSEGPLQLDAGWLSNVTSSNAAVAGDLRRAVVLGPNEIVMALRLGGDSLERLMGDGPLNDDDHAPVQVAAARDLAVHRNEGLTRAIDAAWSGFGPLLENYGATREAQAAFLYGLAKSLLGLASDPARALEVARELAGLGETARSRWVAGEALFQQKDINGAVREWEAVLAVDPENLDALFSLGTLYLDTNDYFAAERYLSQAVRRHSDVPAPRYHYGTALFHVGRYEQAITELRKARELAGGSQSYPLADYLVGLSAERLGRHAEAASALEAYLKWAYNQSVLTRVEVDAHLKLADALDHQGKRFDALRQRQKADELRDRIEAYGRSQQESAAASPESGPAASATPTPSAPPEGGPPSHDDGK